MSDLPHPDLNNFYDTIDQDDDDDVWEDDPDDQEFYLDIEDGMEIDQDDEDDDDDYEDEDDDDEEDDEDMEYTDDRQFPGAYFVAAGDDDDDDEEGGGDGEGIELPQSQWLELAALLSGNTASSEIRQSLLSRLLAGPVGGGQNRSGLQRRSLSSENASLTPEERRRRIAERQKREQWYQPQKVADPRGVELLMSGEFGKVGDWRLPGKWNRPRASEADRRMRRGGIPPMAKVSRSSGLTEIKIILLVF